MPHWPERLFWPACNKHAEKSDCEQSDQLVAGGDPAIPSHRPTWPHSKNIDCSVQLPLRFLPALMVIAIVFGDPGI